MKLIYNGDHAEFEMEHANTPAKERPDWPLPSFDAKDWAEAFLKAYDSAGDDFLEISNMIGWFANALMRGHDEGVCRARKELDNNWRPIDTAPRDGTYILLFNPDYPRPFIAWLSLEGVPIVEPSVIGATHWTPLPSGPTQG